VNVTAYREDGKLDLSKMIENTAAEMERGTEEAGRGAEGAGAAGRGSRILQAGTGCAGRIEKRGLEL